MRFTARNRFRLQSKAAAACQLVLATMRSRGILVRGELRDLEEVGRDDVRAVGILCVKRDARCTAC